MKKTILAVIAGGALLLSSNVASALQYTDNNPADVWLNGLNTSYNGQFTLAGYNPAVEQIDSAVATFTLWDGLFSESWDINIEQSDFANGGSFFGTLNVGGSISATLLGTLSDTGVLNYTVTRNSGEFWLKNAKLVAQSSDRETQPGNRVPDGGTTVALLGMALGLLGFVRRMV